MALSTDDGELILDTDASDVGISGVLSQVQDGEVRLLSYGSRTLSKSERNYCVTDRELLAVHYFVEYYRQYLLGRRFKVRSDHQALVWLCLFKEPKGRICRYLDKLSAYNFEIEFRHGSKHVNADVMSRCFDPWDSKCADEDMMEPLKCGPCRKCQKRAIEMQSSKLWNYEITDETGVSDTFTSECIATSNLQNTANLSVELNKQTYDQIDSRSVTEIRETRSRSQGQSSKDEENGFRFSEFIHSMSELKNMQEKDPDIGPIYRWVRINGPVLAADFGYLRVTIFGTKFQTSVPVY